MIISGGAQFFAEFEQERIVTLSGSLGSGKTLTAHMIAEPYLKRGYRLITNVATVWAEPDWRAIQPLPDHNMQYRVVGLIDEGGLYVRTFKTASKLSSFARKLDSFLIFSGKKKPHEDLCTLDLYLWFDFWKNFLLPFKVYRYDVRVSTTKTYHGFIWVAGWSAYYGLYSTLDPGAYPEEILAAFEQWTTDHFKRYGREYKVQDLVSGDSAVVDMADIQDSMAQTSREVENTLSVLERKTRRR